MVENKLGITDQARFHDVEERIIKLKARELFDKGFVGTNDIAAFDGLSFIHKYLFGDIYETAGQKRTVDIFRGGTRFTLVSALDTEIGFVNIMPSETFDDIVDKYIEMHIAHPFRSGNGIALRIWLNVMLGKKFGSVVDWSRIGTEAFRSAMEMCGVDDAKLYDVLGGALVKDCGRATYMRGIDASLAYEGFTAYRTEEL